MSERQRLPLRLSGERKTAIIERVVGERLKRLKERAELAYPDMILPGMKKLPASQRFLFYFRQTNPRDLLMLEDPDYLQQYLDGFAPPLLSPYWLNLLSDPDGYRDVSADFRTLLREYSS